MNVTPEDIFGPDPMLAALKAEGITPRKLARKLRLELEAKVTKYFQKDGKIVSKRTMIAWDIRQRARMDAHRLMGQYPDPKLDLNVGCAIKVEIIDRFEVKE